MLPTINVAKEPPSRILLHPRPLCAAVQGFSHAMGFINSTTNLLLPCYTKPNRRPSLCYARPRFRFLSSVSSVSFPLPLDSTSRRIIRRSNKKKSHSFVEQAIRFTIITTTVALVTCEMRRSVDPTVRFRRDATPILFKGMTKGTSPKNKSDRLHSRGER